MAQPTMVDVAERAGVSRALVSLVMRNAPNVSEHRRAAVLKAAEELGYRPNVLARNLASHRTLTFGVMVNDLHNPFFAETIDGIDLEASANGYRMLLASGRRSVDGERAAIETFLDFRVDGVILTGPRLPKGDIVAAAKTTPVVLVGRRIDSDRVDTINNDEGLGAQLAVSHLLDLGHARIAHIDGGDGAGAAQRRLGYEVAMTEAGFEQHISVAPGDFTDRGGYAGADLLLDADVRPTAVFAANDQTAAGALDRFEDAGMRVPDDISIVGYDNTALAAMHHMSMTTINQPREEMGRIAVGAMLQRLNDERTDAVHHIVTPSLVTRGTTGKAPPP